jgi:hypothetical protein
LSLKNIRKEAKAAYKNDERYTLFQAHVDGIIKSLDKRHPPLPVKTDGAKADGAPSQSEVSGKEEGTAVSVELSSPTGPNENENANADVVVPALTSTGGGKAPEEPEPEAKDEEFVVEKIVGKKTEEGDVLYHVKWQGYGEEDNTWEPVSNFNDDAPIAAYEEAIKKGKEENEGPVITAKMEGSSAVEEGAASTKLEHSTPPANAQVPVVEEGGASQIEIEPAAMLVAEQTPPGTQNENVAAETPVEEQAQVAPVEVEVEPVSAAVGGEEEQTSSMTAGVIGVDIPSNDGMAPSSTSTDDVVMSTEDPMPLPIDGIKGVTSSGAPENEDITKASSS